MLMECEVNGKNDDVSPRSLSPSSPPSTEDSPNGLNGEVPAVSEEKEYPTVAEIQATLRQEYDAELNRLRKEFDRKMKEATRDKELMVMRYANGEKEILKVRKEMDVLSRQLQNMGREVDSLNKKNKILGTERERLINMVDSKVNDIQSLQKECDRLKEDNSSKDFKIKWIQTKLNTESDAHKETQGKLEKCSLELREALDEANRMRQDCQDMINSYTPNPLLPPQMCSTTDSVDSVTTEGDVKVSETVNDESAGPEGKPEAPALNAFQKEIEILKGKHGALINENNSLSCRVQSLQQERLDLEHKMSRLQESNADHLHQIASLQSDLSSAESLRIQLMSEQERVASLQAECEGLRQCNSELLADMALCRGKESELLAYTQQVTEKNVQLQSEFSSVEAKSLMLEGESERLLSRIEDLLSQVAAAEKLVLQEKKSGGLERQRLLAELEQEKTTRLKLEQKLEEAYGDAILLKKKHETSMRELMKELKTAMRSSKELTNGNGSGDGISQSSRTSSSTSLNTMDAQSTHSQKSNDQELEGPVIPDQQVLVERIVKLQRMLAKKQEKNEFLEEYAKELRETAKRQRKIIQTYAMSQDGGTMSSDISDQNKAEFVKHGGVMGSLYSSKAIDEGLTLELSLEINRKLQAVLEDTLLKNITLKENLSTLGEENSKLSERLKKLDGAG